MGPFPRTGPAWNSSKLSAEKTLTRKTTVLDIRKMKAEGEKIKGATGEQAVSVRLVTQSIEDVSSMTSQIFKASKEQSNATRNIGRAIDSIKELTHEMVGATGRQVEDGEEIKKTVDAVGQMVMAIFDDMEKRREESGVVLKELEVMKGATK